MQIIIPTTSIPLGHPIELMAGFVDVNEWRLHRFSETEIMVEIPGKWSDYTLTLAWQAPSEALHIDVLLDIVIIDQQLEEARETIALINKCMWLGHFDLFTSNGSVVFRYTLPLDGTGGATPEQIEGLIDVTLGQCERAYLALSQVAGGAASARTAVDIAMLETVGSA